MATRSVLDRLRAWLSFGWRALTSGVGLIRRHLGLGPAVDPHTRLTFKAVVDAVVPEAAALGDELGPEHVPGGLAIDLDAFAITYIDNGFQLGLPLLGPQGNIPLADPVAHVLDSAALRLLDRGDNHEPPEWERAAALVDPDDPLRASLPGAIGPFAELSRTDRLRAIGILDEFEVEFSPDDHDLVELDGGLVGQLVIGFVEMIYYSEWQGYDEYVQPPSDRRHPNDPSAVQSWRQTGYPGVAYGYAALRGYLGRDDGPLGGGERWASVDEANGVEIVMEPGSFRENDFDTAGYAEPHPE